MDTLSATTTACCRYRYDALDRLAGACAKAQEPVLQFYQRSRLSVETQGALHRRVVRFQGGLLAEQRFNGSLDQADLLGTDLQGSVLHALDGQHSQSLGLQQLKT